MNHKPVRNLSIEALFNSMNPKLVTHLPMEALFNKSMGPINPNGKNKTTLISLTWRSRLSPLPIRSSRFAPKFWPYEPMPAQWAAEHASKSLASLDFLLINK